MKSTTLENTLKEMILREELAPGERITEAALAERLGVSRTPVRNLMPRLAAEGFVKPVGKRGFAVADFSEQETFDALELRALLEGWAARNLAERGAAAEVLAELQECLTQGDSILACHGLNLDDEQQYGEMNARFHRTIIQAVQSPLLQHFIDRLNHVPFVAPSVIVFDQIGLRAAYDMLHRAHGFHHAIVDAIRTRDGARAEFLFREHANHQRVSMFERRKEQQKSGSNGSPRPEADLRPRQSTQDTRHRPRLGAGVA